MLFQYSKRMFRGRNIQEGAQLQKSNKLWQDAADQRSMPHGTYIHIMV